MYSHCACTHTCGRPLTIASCPQMMFHCKETSQPFIDVSQLNECFMKWMQKLSTTLGKPNAEKVVIVIDSADLITVRLFCVHGHWLWCICIY